MTIEKIYTMTISKTVDMFPMPARTEMVISSPSNISLNVDAGEIRGGMHNDILTTYNINPVELFGDGVEIVLDALVDPGNGEPIYRTSLDIFPPNNISKGV